MKPKRRTLSRYLSRCDIASRKQAEQWIRDGRVQVNKRVILDPEAWILEGQDLIYFDHRLVNSQKDQRVYAYNKPRGILVSEKDPQGRPIYTDQLPPALLDLKLRAVGRLDQASAGLLLLTNDTDLANRLLGPHSKICKHYRVKLTPAPSAEQVQTLSSGIEIGENTPTAPAEISVIRNGEKSAVLNFELIEGRNRQIRRMAEAIGCQVEWLVRTQFGPVMLKDLEPGKLRELSKSELNALPK